MDREHLVDRIAANAAPDQRHVKDNKGPHNHTAAFAAPAEQPRWLQPIANYVRQQPREYQVMRFG